MLPVKMTPPATGTVVKMTPPATGATETQLFYLSGPANFKGPIYKDNWTKVPSEPVCEAGRGCYGSRHLISHWKGDTDVKAVLSNSGTKKTPGGREALQMDIQVRGKGLMDRCLISHPEAGGGACGKIPIFKWVCMDW